MTAAMEVLYSYAQDYMVPSLLAREPEYADTLFHADRQEERLRALLDGPVWDHLESLLDEYNQLTFHRGQALFHAGFQLAAELLRP